MINRIQQIITKPMTARTPQEEAVGILIILLYILAVWAVGEIVYLIEKHKRGDK